MTSQTSKAPVTFGELLAARAERSGDDLAFIFLNDGERDEDAVSYGELHARTATIAARLLEHTAAESRVLLLFPPGLDYIAAVFGCFHAGMVGVSAQPPHPKRLNRTLPRLLAIAADADVACVLTTPAIADAAAPLLGEGPLAQARWIAVDTAGENEPTSAPDLPPAAAASSDLAFLQYTSGSTADPRGVMLTHGNLLDNSRFIARAFGHSAESKGFIWLPPYHDMGLIGGILQPVFVGFPCVLTSPIAVVRRPSRWLEGISRYRATTSGGPNFAFDLCVRRITPEVRERLDLSSWDLAFNGAEPVRAATQDAFVSAFGPCGFRREAFFPCYGLAEATLMVTAPQKEAEPTQRQFDGPMLELGVASDARQQGAGTTHVSCGRPSDYHTLVVVDPKTARPCEPDRIGEIWVSGPSVAKGYWRREEETRSTFAAQLSSGPGGPRFLRTGDLGVMKDGELYVTGRLKDMLIVNGRNIHPHDIEAVAEEADTLLRQHSSAVFEYGGRVAIVLESEAAEPETLTAVVDAVRRRVATELDVQLHAIVLCERGAVPKTTSGKIQRQLCRQLLADRELESVASWFREEND